MDSVTKFLYWICRNFTVPVIKLCAFYAISVLVFIEQSLTVTQTSYWFLVELRRRQVRKFNRIVPKYCVNFSEQTFSISPYNNCTLLHRCMFKIYRNKGAFALSVL